MDGTIRSRSVNLPSWMRPGRLAVAVYGVVAAIVLAGVILLSWSFFQVDTFRREALGKLGTLLIFTGMLTSFAERFLEYMTSPPPDPGSREAVRAKTALIGSMAGISILLGDAVIVMQRYSSSGTDSKALAVLSMWGGACLLLGVLTGFLFGVPQNIQSSQLEQISDWITKIIVGVGLTQLNKIPHKLHVWAQEIADQAGGGGAGSPPPPTSFIIALILFFVTVGFLTGYLLTRMFLGDDGGPRESEVTQKIGAGGLGVVVDSHPNVTAAAPGSATADHQEKRAVDAAAAALKRPDATRAVE